MARHGIQNNYDEYAKPPSGKVNEHKNIWVIQGRRWKRKKESKGNDRNQKHCNSRNEDCLDGLINRPDRAKEGISILEDM